MGDAGGNDNNKKDGGKKLSEKQLQNIDKYI